MCAAHKELVAIRNFGPKSYFKRLCSLLTSSIPSLLASLPHITSLLISHLSSLISHLTPLLHLLTSLLLLPSPPPCSSSISGYSPLSHPSSVLAAKNHQVLNKPHSVLPINIFFSNNRPSSYPKFPTFALCSTLNRQSAA